MNSTTDTGVIDRDEWYFARVRDENGNRYTVHSVRQRPTSEGLEFFVDWTVSMIGGDAFRTLSRATIQRSGCPVIIETAHSVYLLSEQQAEQVRKTGGFEKPPRFERDWESFNDDTKRWGVLPISEEVHLEFVRKAADDLVSYCVAAGTFDGYGCVDYVLENEGCFGNPFKPWPAAETEVSA